MPKKCLFDGKVFEKRVTESNYDWKKRRFCNKKCANTYVVYQKFGDPLTRTEKICGVCRIKQPLENFCRNRCLPDKHQSLCKVCQQNLAYQRSGWTSELKQTAFVNQEGKCAICGKSLKSWQKAAGDHDHKTGKPRKLLCFFCNHLLYILESPILLDTAKQYLQSYEA